jgi:hypothetical protein
MSFLNTLASQLIGAGIGVLGVLLGWWEATWVLVGANFCIGIFLSILVQLKEIPHDS